MAASSVWSTTWAMQVPPRAVPGVSSTGKVRVLVVAALAVGDMHRGAGLSKHERDISTDATDRRQ
jgi:hypothetical protein